MNLFWVDPRRKVWKEYSHLFRDLAETVSASRYISREDPYRVFVELIRSLAAGEPVDLLDHDFSERELAALGIPPSTLDERHPVAPLRVESHDELLGWIESGRRDWRLALYTSGTTGTPKRVVHTLDTLTRSVRRGERYLDNVWGFAYNPTHLAGLQVFFQAFLNGNPMVNLFDSPRQEVDTLLEERRITHLSATPTFYRTVLPYLKREFPAVRQVTSGGERFDIQLAGEIKRCFPRARILNIYASTEAGSLLVASGERFRIPAEMKDRLRISPVGELLIRRDLLGEGLGELVEGEWYRTGDVVESAGGDEIRFLSRDNDIVKVAGYPVNPLEVEEEIRKQDGVVDVRVVARSSRVTGSILTAEIVKAGSIGEAELEAAVLERLGSVFQPWKIPRLIRFVGEIARGRTGKKVRE